jgi:hypothetical protein
MAAFRDSDRELVSHDPCVAWRKSAFPSGMRGFPRTASTKCVVHRTSAGIQFQLMLTTQHVCSIIAANT